MEATVPKPQGRETLPGDDLGKKDPAHESDASVLAAGHGAGTGRGPNRGAGCPPSQRRSRRERERRSGVLQR